MLYYIGCPFRIALLEKKLIDFSFDGNQYVREYPKLHFFRILEQLFI